MGPKRDLSALAESEGEDVKSHPLNKRPKKQQAPLQSKGKEQQLPQTDATYGQRCVFPLLDDQTAPSDEDLELEDETDALAYLRSVRQEASGIPHLLVAPKAGPQLPSPSSSSYLDYRGHNGARLGRGADRSIYENGVGDSRGYYHDGAYTAAPDGDGEDEDGEDENGTAAAESREIYNAYFASMTERFSALRAQLHRPPPQSVIDGIPPKHETSVGPFGPRTSTFRVWSRRLRDTDPLPAQVAAMDKGSVLRLLRIIHGGKFLRRGCELRERTSRWLWALLARLPDRGELDHADVGWVRELGKRAVLLMTSIAEMAALREAVEQLHDREEDEEPVEMFVDEDDDGDTPEDEQALKRDAQVADEDQPKGSPVRHAVIAPAAVRLSEDSDADLEEGEVSDEPSSSSVKDPVADIAAAKARLLAKLDGNVVDLPDTELEPEDVAPVVDNQEEAQDIDSFDETRSRVNMRATLNMILTVAGEFYGQRDLLEFRDPFRGL